MLLKINGDTQHFDKQGVTIDDLLRQEKIQAPEMVSVQRNGEFVERGEYATTVLSENDEIDFLYFMGGGAR